MLIEEKKKEMPKYLQIFRAGLRCYGSEKMVAKVKKMSGILGISQEPGT